MKRIGMISTAVLSLALGVAAPAFAQEQHDQQDEQKAKAGQEEKKPQPEKSAKPEQKNTKPEEKNAQQDKNNRNVEKPQSSNARSNLSLESRSSAPAITVVAASLTTASRPTLESNTGSM